MGENDKQRANKAQRHVRKTQRHKNSTEVIRHDHDQWEREATGHLHGEGGGDKVHPPCSASTDAAWALVET